MGLIFPIRGSSLDPSFQFDQLCEIDLSSSIGCVGINYMGPIFPVQAASLDPSFQFDRLHVIDLSSSRLVLWDQLYGLDLSYSSNCIGFIFPV
jgi:hypothetical protein